MVLVDTSVWVRHLRGGDPRLASLLLQGTVACHPFIVGELACGDMRNRSEILSLLEALPRSKTATHEEAMRFIEANNLAGRGVGYVDVHLLASAVLSDLPLWTLDKPLRLLSSRLKVRYEAADAT